jgi:hypothetical protein
MAKTIAQAHEILGGYGRRFEPIGADPASVVDVGLGFHPKIRASLSFPTTEQGRNNYCSQIVYGETL